jgi:uncharacterized membrane protein
MDPADLQEARRLMQLEYETAIKGIADFDDQRGRIKQWAITVAGALLALAVSADSWSLGVIATATIIFFAYMDIMYMAAQMKIIKRSHELESFMEKARRGDFAAADSYIFGVGEAHGREIPWRLVLAELRRRPQIVVFMSA